jgi:hypothetical protein
MNNKEQKNGFAIASLVTSLIGLLLFIAPYIGIFLSVIAIVFASIQKKNGSNGMATAGLVLGIIGIISNLFWLFIVLMMFLGGMI